MDKKKKQLVMLIGLVIVAGVVAIFMVPRLFNQGTPPPVAAGDPAAGQPAPGQPAPGQPVPGQPGAPGTSGAVVAKDLPKPDLKVPAALSFTVDTKGMRDPLKVLDPDAAYSGQQDEVKTLKVKWALRGIVIGGIEIVKTYKKNPDGTENPVPEQIEREIWVCFFDNNPRFYREGDRLEDTHFTVKSIHFDAEGAFVEVEGDLGIRVKLHMITNDRYK